MRSVLPICVVVFATVLVLPAVAALRTNVVERSYDRFGRLCPWLTDASANAAARAALDAVARLMSSDGRALVRIADVVVGGRASSALRQS